MNNLKRIFKRPSKKFSRRISSITQYAVTPWVLFVGIIALFLFVQFSFFHYFLAEDTYITLRIANNFVDGHGLVFNVGDPVEVNTSFLWTIILAGFIKLGFETLFITKFLSVFFAVACIFLVYVLARRFLGLYEGLLPSLLLSC